MTPADDLAEMLEKVPDDAGWSLHKYSKASRWRNEGRDIFCFRLGGQRASVREGFGSTPQEAVRKAMGR